MRIISSLLVVAILALTGCMNVSTALSQAPRSTTLGAERVELPAVFVNGRPYLDVMLNGKGPYRFLVDTGAEITTVNPHVARKVGITVSRKYSVNVTGSSGQSELQYAGMISRVESPQFSLRGMGASIAGPQTPDYQGKMGDRDYGGILGMNAFRDLLLEVDFPRQKISVARLTGPSLPAMEGIPYTGIRPHVTITTPSTRQATTSAVIDTGSDGEWEFADPASFPLRVGLTKADYYAFGIGGYWRPVFGQIAGDIRLGTAIWRDSEICSGNKNRLGSKALAPWKLVIDQQRKILWLSEMNQMTVTTWTGPLEADGRPAVYGFAALPEKEAYVVHEVDPGSRAERAGLRVGDRVLADGFDLGKTGMAPENETQLVRLRVRRGTDDITIVMSLSDGLAAGTMEAPSVK